MNTVVSCKSTTNCPFSMTMLKFPHMKSRFSSKEHSSLAIFEGKETTFPSKVTILCSKIYATPANKIDVDFERSSVYSIDQNQLQCIAEDTMVTKMIYPRLHVYSECAHPFCRSESFNFIQLKRVND